jgi:molecular chaperone DnaK
MDTEKRTGIQLTHQPSKQEISIVDGGIKIKASEKPIATSFLVNYGKIFIILDCSGSMKGPKLDQAKVGIIDFAKDAYKKEYQVGFIKFSDRANLLCELTNDIDIIQNSLKGIRAGGSTNLTAAIKMAHSKLKDFKSTRVMVIATDGMPDDIKSSLEEANKAKVEGIEILTIGTDDADTEFLKKLASKAELSAKVSSDRFAQAISSASLLLMSPRSIKPK